MMMMKPRMTTLAACLVLAACVSEKTSDPTKTGKVQDPAGTAKTDKPVVPVDPGGATGKDAKDAPSAAKPAAPVAAAPAAGAAAPTPAATLPKAPDSFKVKFDTTVGEFTVAVTRAWSPNGADRFHEMVAAGFYKDIAFFRVIDGFMVQFGVHGDPKVAARWRSANIKDDPVQQSNTRGMVTFAKTGMPNSRSTQLFINFGDNRNLDGMGFSPFGKVVEGMDVVDRIYKVGEGAPGGPGPEQNRLQVEGNAYLKRSFPKLDYIKSASLVK
jgi:peptidyl-prolyl cis-trans isomerase A (cyclophilin A)